MALHDHPQAPPSVGSSAPQQTAPPTPPANPQARQELKSKWMEFLAKPEVQAGLFQFSVNVLQPPQPGQSTLGHVASSFAGGGEAVGRVQAQGRVEDKEDFRRSDVREGRAIQRETLSAAEVRQRIASEASLAGAVTAAEASRDVAGIGATSRKDIAGIGAKSAANVANINLGGTLGAADRAAASRKEVAGIGAKSRLDVAGIAAGATTTAAETAGASREQAATISGEATKEAARIRTPIPDKFRPLTPEERTALKIPEGFLAQINNADGQITTTDLSGKTQTMKAVLDKAASAKAGKPVTLFATPADIAASGGNFIPVPRGISLRTSTDKAGTTTTELATEGQGLPPATETRTLARVTAGRELLTNIGTLMDQVEEGGATVSGPVGAFRGFINVTLASFIPALFSKDRALFERELKLTREASKRAVSDEERFTDQDRAFVNELFPTPGVFGNPQVADAKLQVMAAFFLRRLGPDLEALEINTAEIATFGVADLLKLGGNGLLTAQEVRRSAEFLFPGQVLDVNSVLNALVEANVSTQEMDPIIRQLFPGVLK